VEEAGMQQTIKLREELLVKIRTLIGKVIKEKPIICTPGEPNPNTNTEEIGQQLELGLE